MVTLCPGEFRQRSNRFKTVAEVQRAVLSAASSVASVSRIREMAIVNPEERASAAQMLLKRFDGAAPPSLTTRTPQTKPRDLQMNGAGTAKAGWECQRVRWDVAKA